MSLYSAALALAVLAGGLGPHAAPVPVPPKEQPALPPLPVPPQLDELFGQLTPEQARELRRSMEMARRQMERMRQEMRARRLPGGRWEPLPFGRPVRPEGRLGVRVAVPGATLADQLDLPRGQGLALEEVTPGSAADQAGLKAHDILLEFADKPVPSDPTAFARLVREVKADTPVEAVILRKGRRETIKGVKLPEAVAERPDLLPAPLMRPRSGGRATSAIRTGNQFTVREHQGRVFLTVTGKVEGGRAVVTDVVVQEGGLLRRYTSAQEVPEPYRDRVLRLVETVRTVPAAPSR